MFCVRCRDVAKKKIFFVEKVAYNIVNIVVFVVV